MTTSLATTRQQRCCRCGSPRSHRRIDSSRSSASRCWSRWPSSVEDNSFREGQLTQALIYASAIAGLNLATGYTGMLSIAIRRSSASVPTRPASWCRSTTGSVVTFLPALGICFVFG